MKKSLKESIVKILSEGPTSQRNLKQFRERMASERAQREARAENLRAQRKAEQEARNTPEAKAERAARAEQSRQRQAEYARTHPNAGKIADHQDVDSSGRPLSINKDGSFNISPEQQAQAQANRDAVNAGRAQDAERSRRIGVPAQQGVQGYDDSGKTIKPNPNFHYTDPRSPEGRVFSQIEKDELPTDVLDTTRNMHKRIIDRVRTQLNKEVPERNLDGPNSEPTEPQPKPEPNPTPPPTEPQPKPESETNKSKPPSDNFDEVLSTIIKYGLGRYA